MPQECARCQHCLSMAPQEHPLTGQKQEVECMEQGRTNWSGGGDGKKPCSRKEFCRHKAGSWLFSRRQLWRQVWVCAWQCDTAWTPWEFIRAQWSHTCCSQVPGSPPARSRTQLPAQLSPGSLLPPQQIPAGQIFLQQFPNLTQGNKPVSRQFPRKIHDLTC